RPHRHLHSVPTLKTLRRLRVICLNAYPLEALSPRMRVAGRACIMRAVCNRLNSGFVMQAYQRDFIRFAIERGVLRFGEFTLKSGRTSPYFFNAGLFNSGGALAKLGQFYAAAIQDSGIDFDVLFGPAYKGIPLAATTAVA